MYQLFNFKYINPLKLKVPFIFKNWYIRTPAAFLVGACGTLSFSPYNFWPAAIFSLVSLLILISSHLSLYKIVIDSLFWSLGLFSSGIHWIYFGIISSGLVSKKIAIILILILIFYLSLYPIVFTVLLNYLFPTISIIRMILAAPILWCSLEYLRERIFTGFPWLKFGYSQIDGPLKFIAPLFGVDGITFILIMISGLVSYAKLHHNWRINILALAALFLPYSLKYLFHQHKNFNCLINIVLVQGNIPNFQKYNKKQLNDILNTYTKLTNPFLNKKVVIIWPESAVPDLEINQQFFLTKISKKLYKYRSSLITGILDFKLKNHSYYNSMIVLGNGNFYSYTSKNHYWKNHLVPFGEFIPCSGLLHLLINFNDASIFTFSKGPYYQSQLKVNNCKFSAAICYEIIFGKRIKDNFSSNTDFLLNISDDSWFNNSIGPWQHFQISRMRALELGRPLIRCTNNGITGIINSDGSIAALLPRFTRSVLDIIITPTTINTFYSRIGNISIWLMLTTTSIIIYLLKLCDIYFFKNCKFNSN